MLTPEIKQKVIEEYIEKKDWNGLINYGTEWGMLTPELKEKIIDWLIEKKYWAFIVTGKQIGRAHV